jgi:hypothetical protein
VFELSWFQQCGSTHAGFAVSAGAPASAWRACQPNQMDMYCRDRFRFEWSQSGFVAYVNGIKFAEDSGWPGYAQIPADIAGGQVPVYAYFGEWGDFSDSNVYRFHWGRVAVNPHDAGGNLLGPSAAPSYCPGRAQNTCAMGFMPSMAPSGMPGPPMNHGTTHGQTGNSHAGGAHGPHTGAAASHVNSVEVYTSAALAGMLNGGQRPEFWILLGVMVAGVVAATVVSWLWRGSTRHGGTG